MPMRLRPFLRNSLPWRVVTVVVVLLVLVVVAMLLVLMV